MSTPDTLENELFIAQVDKYLIYDFRADGFHDGAQRVTWPDIGRVLLPIVKLAKAEGRKVIVTDTGDLCLFHLENGVVVFPTAEDIAAARAARKGP